MLNSQSPFFYATGETRFMRAMRLCDNNPQLPDFEKELGCYCQHCDKDLSGLAARDFVRDPAYSIEGARFPGSTRCKDCDRELEATLEQWHKEWGIPPGKKVFFALDGEDLIGNPKIAMLVEDKPN